MVDPTRVDVVLVAFLILSTIVTIIDFVPTLEHSRVEYLARPWLWRHATGITSAGMALLLLVAIILRAVAA